MIRETIQNVVANITETCMNEDVYVTDEESIHLPSRGAIIGIIKDLRRCLITSGGQPSAIQQLALQPIN